MIILFSDNFSHKVEKGKEISIRCHKETEKKKFWKTLQKTENVLRAIKKKMEVDKEELIDDANKRAE